MSSGSIEANIALPETIFYNTGIGADNWIVTNGKEVAGFPRALRSRFCRAGSPRGHSRADLRPAGSP